MIYVLNREFLEDVLNITPQGDVRASFDAHTACLRIEVDDGDDREMYPMPGGTILGEVRWID